MGYIQTNSFVHIQSIPHSNVCVSLILAERICHKMYVKLTQLTGTDAKYNNVVA